jgi:hypothetical protein
MLVKKFSETHSMLVIVEEDEMKLISPWEWCLTKFCNLQIKVSAPCPEKWESLQRIVHMTVTGYRSGHES